MKYHIWTAGCQMNVADSLRVASSLEQLGYVETASAETADVIVLNTCVVRQSAEDKGHGRLMSLKPLKQANPNLVINLMGCMVGVNPVQEIRERYPFVDVFSPPSDPTPLISHLLESTAYQMERQVTNKRYAWMDGELVLPQNGQVTAYIPVVYGCSHACSFCIIPYRRGAERSRPLPEIVREAQSLISQGVREITLLGQIVDRYGLDLDDPRSLVELLRAIHDIPELKRIRFLTSHPNWMNESLLEAVAELPKICRHIEVPVQAGDDEILARMKRGYTADDYRRLIARIRQHMPDAAIATDIIVGFPGETEDQFQRTYDLLAELKLDVAHLARYSPRPQTLATRRMNDDVLEEEKMRRFRRLEGLQAEIAGEINRQLIGQNVEVLVEEEHNGRWKGRTPTNKLVFFEDPRDLRGECVQVRIEWAGPWSMRGALLDASTVAVAPVSAQTA